MLPVTSKGHSGFGESVIEEEPKVGKLEHETRMFCVRISPLPQPECLFTDETFNAD